mgnify:CR=1 FL=1
MYEKLSGMTGTAKTEEDEFKQIYKLKVIVVPTNRPVARVDLPDVIYMNKNAKYKAIARKIEELYQKGQPVLPALGFCSLVEWSHRYLLESSKSLPRRSHQLLELVPQR